MGYTYGFIGRKEVPASIYKKAITYAVDANQYYSHESKDQWEQYVSFDSSVAGVIYLFRETAFDYNVLTDETLEKEVYSIGVKVCSRKRNEPRSLNDIVEDIEYIRQNIEKFISIELESYVQIKTEEIEIYLAEAEYPFLQL